MLININDVLSSGLSLDIDQDGPELVEMALGGAGKRKADTLGFSFLSPVHVHLDLSRLEGDLIIDGTLKTTLGLQCGRCLKDFRSEVASKFSYCTPVDLDRAIRSGVEAGDEESALEMAASHIEGDEINITALVLEQVSLEAPLKPLCAEDCKGLCLSCGTDLNAGSCKCTLGHKIDTRLAGLKEFRAKK